MPTFYEFFAGGGMARAGLGDAWECLFANDIDPKKGSSYLDNWKDEVLRVENVGRLTTADLPGIPDLVWASFPCQDLSLAGNGAGLKGTRSGTFWPFWELVKGLHSEERHPSVIVLENVCGALTSHDGSDFRSLISALRQEGYKAGAVVIDAALFVPQSRPRLFIIGVCADVPTHSLTTDQPTAPFHTTAIRTAYQNLPPVDREDWLWWKLPKPAPRMKTFADIVEHDAPWHTKKQTDFLLSLMLPRHRAKVETAKKMKRRIIGTIYKRTRPDKAGIRAQRAEIRFDDIAGCLRTPGGGSSRQSILVVEGDEVRSRLLTPREAARLMGLGNEYILPDKYNDAYHLMGDGLVVPVVSHIATYLLAPLIRNLRLRMEDAA
jgi:DNA (cytosine-5)-methyltransferase 1